MRRRTCWFLWAALSGLFFEALAWATRTDFTHWVKMRETPSLVDSVDSLRRTGVL